MVITESRMKKVIPFNLWLKKILNIFYQSDWLKNIRLVTFIEKAKRG